MGRRGNEERQRRKVCTVDGWSDQSGGADRGQTKVASSLDCRKNPGLVAVSARGTIRALFWPLEFVARVAERVQRSKLAQTHTRALSRSLTNGQGSAFSGQCSRWSEMG